MAKNKPPRKRYIKQKKLNNNIINSKIDEIGKKLDIQEKIIKAKSDEFDKHIEHLANFTSHDVKNSIQSMDSVLYNIRPEEVTQESLETLMTCLNGIRESLDNFKKIIPFSKSKTYSFNRLLISLKLLSKERANELAVNIEFPEPNEVTVIIPFQGVLMMLHNLIINSFNSFCKAPVESPKIKIETSITNTIEIRVSDNGKQINPKIIDKIFNYGFTSTDGSGIGLFHAKYICNELLGDITLETQDLEEFNKTFIISLPITSNKNE